MNNYITLETAMLAKEAEFDKPCDKVYCCFAENNECACLLWRDGIGDDSDIISSAEAPQQHELQTWLRHKHNLHVHPHWVEKGYTVYEKGNEMMTTGWYSTYEESLEEGLKEALKYLIDESESK